MTEVKKIITNIKLVDEQRPSMSSDEYLVYRHHLNVKINEAICRENGLNIVSDYNHTTPIPYIRRKDVVGKVENSIIRGTEITMIVEVPEGSITEGAEYDVLSVGYDDKSATRTVHSVICVISLKDAKIKRGLK